MTSLYIMPIILAIVVIIHGHYRRQYFGLLELHFFAITLYFSIYTLIDQILNPPIDVNELVVIELFGLLTATVMMTALYKYLCGPFIRKRTSLSYMAMSWTNANQRTMMWILVIVILFNISLYLKFGIISHFSDEELRLLGIEIPSWVGPLKVSLTSLAFSVFLFACSSLILNKGKEKRLLNIIFICVTLIIFALNGRRSIINLAIIAIPLLHLARGRSLYSMRNFLYFALAGLMLIIFSNIYQTYRGELLSVSGARESKSLPNLYEAATNFESTTDNLVARMAMWKFNYAIANQQFMNDIHPLFGELHWKTFLNAVPSFLWPEKTYIDADFIVASRYGLNGMIDYPTSNFSSMQADFGVGTILLYPFLVIVPMVFLALIRVRPDFYIICSGLIISELLNIETTGGSIFMLFRNILMWGCIFYLIRILNMNMVKR